MKYNILPILFLLLFSSCEDFLEEKPKDKVIPETVREYEELFYGEAYMRDNKALVAGYIDLLTDDVTSSSRTSGRTTGLEDAFGYFAWQADPELTMTGGRNDDDAWKWYYHSILMCNMILNDVPDAEGTQIDKDDLMAEAHFLRAWNYFMLVNLYGEPFNEATAATDLGVPINDVTGVEDKKFLRASVAEIYQLMEEDLDLSVSLFLSSNKEKDHFKGNISAAYLLASRVALFQKKYQESANFAGLALADKYVLYDLNTKSEDDLFINYKNPEILFSFGDHSIIFYRKLSFWARVNFIPSDELMNLYAADDLRTDHFFDRGLTTKSESGDETGEFAFAMRTAELYLNRAEAYAELGEIDKAMTDLNKLRESRFSSTDYALTAQTKEEAILLVRDERRMELCFERHRWFDLRRWDRPSITHVLIRDKKNDIIETYVLEKDDPAYTLPIPFDVTTINKEIKNINRPVRNPEN